MNGALKISALAIWLAAGAAGPADAAGDSLGHGRTTARVNLRADAGTGHPVLRTLQPGATLDILRSDGEWLRVRTTGAEGWVHSDFARVSFESAVTTDRINLRAGASMDAPRIQVLDPHRVLPVLETRDQWIRVTVPGLEGWVHRDFVDADLEPPLDEVIIEAAAIGPVSPAGEASASGSTGEAPLAQPAGETPLAQPEAEVPLAQPAAENNFTPDFLPNILATYVNNQKVSEGVRVWRSESTLLFPDNVRSELRLRKEAFNESIVVSGREYVRLDEVDGLLYWVDEPKQDLWLVVEPELFTKTTIELGPRRYAKPSRSSLGSFANYSLNASAVTDGDPRMDGRFELGGFGKWGTGSVDLLVRGTEDEFETTRLTASWTLDLPERKQTVRIGDSVSRAGSWWQSVYLGGVSWSTNFSTQPGFIPYALPNFAGEAALPSEFELYLGEVLRHRERLPSGPFEIRNLPVVAGDGSFRAVVRDQLGRETVLTRDFYLSPSLLRKGLREFHYDLGLIRENFGQQSNSYGRPALVATERYGVNDRLTLELHSEVLDEFQLLGVGGSFAVGRYGVGNLTLAASEGANGTRLLRQYGFDRQGRRAGFGFQIQEADPDFERLGLGSRQLAPTQSIRARAAIALGRSGSLALAYSSRERAELQEFETLSLSLGAQLGQRFYLNVGALSSSQANSDLSLSVSITRFLGPGRAASTRLTQDGQNRNTAGVRYQKANTRGKGIGYLVSAEGGDSPQGRASLEHRGRAGHLVVEAARRNNSDGVRASWRGSLVRLGGETFAAPPTERSFGLVSTSGVPGIRVYHQNHLIGSTDERGFLVIPGMLPFQENRLRIEKDDLPFGGRVDHIETSVSPYADSGLVVDFPVHLSRSALLTLLDEEGEPIPAGAVVRSLRTGEEFPVAYDGKVYVVDLELQEEFEVRWADQRCSAAVQLAAEVVLEARPEPIICRRPE